MLSQVDGSVFFYQRWFLQQWLLWEWFLQQWFLGQWFFQQQQFFGWPCRRIIVLVRFPKFPSPRFPFSSNVSPE